MNRLIIEIGFRMFKTIQFYKKVKNKVKNYFIVRKNNKMKNANADVEQLQQVLNWLSAENVAIMENQGKIANKLDEIVNTQHNLHALYCSLSEKKAIKKEAKRKK